MSKYIPVIGLEIHAELDIDSKLFCTCGAAFGGDPNSRCCPGCVGMPGTLPVLNQKAVEYAVKAGYAFGCNISQYSVWDRKNYFYPDLPAAYQVSQLEFPLCIGGGVEIDTPQGKKFIRLNRIHLEEDAGKLVHDDFNAVSYPDYNRCGRALIEIVTEPDLSSADEAKAFMEQVILLLKYAGVCECKMEQGTLRCDVNVSVMKPTDTKYGTRTECKNLNSLKSIGRAIDFEIKRHSTLLDLGMGHKIVQETRRYNDNKGETTSMRSKENAMDYRYFPDPNIPAITLTDEELAVLRATLPEMPAQRLNKYTSDYGLSVIDAKTIINDKAVSDFFESALKVYNAPKAVANFITGELLRRINLGEISMESLSFSAEEFAKLVEMGDTEKVSKNDAKKLFRMMVETGRNAEELAKENGMLITNDLGKVSEIIDSVFAENSAVIEQYRNGETKVFGFIMGLCSKALKGVCTPKVIKEELERKLAELADVSDETEEEGTETEAAALDMTEYSAANAYKPAVTDSVMQICGTVLKNEFVLTDLTENIGGEVNIDCCVHKVRNMGGLVFIIVRTGRYTLQTIYSTNECSDKIGGIKEGCFVNITGTVKASEKAMYGAEIILSGIKLISMPADEYPLRVSKSRLGCAIDVNLNNRSVALRNPYERAIFKLQEGVCDAFRRFMLSQNFTEIHSPKIVAQGAEGGANIFHLEYFGKHAFLNQSPQFYKQTAVAFFDRVFEIAPVFRAEKHATSRHINEYISLDFEMGYIDSMYDVMAMETAMLKYVMQYVKTEYANEIELLEADIPEITEIPCVTLLEAKEILADKASGNKLDLEPEDEVALCEYAKRVWNSDFIFVTHFPDAKPPFYAMTSREDPRLAYKFDLLFRGLEITSGGQRIHDYNEQLAKMKAQGLDPEEFKSYLEAHKYGLPPHGGLGIGLERLVMKLLKMGNIRQTSMFPRDINRLLP